MRESIDTVPKDGKWVVLEDDANAAFEVARWSAEAGCWVGEEGEPSRIIPKYWHLLSPWHPLSREHYQSASGKRGFGLFSFFLRRVARDGSAVPKDEAASSRFVAVATPLANVNMQTARGVAERGSDARWRRGVSSLISSLFGAARVAAPFRGNLAAYIKRYAHQIAVASRNVANSRRRLTVSVITAILVAAVFVGLLFRSELATYSMHYANQIGAVSSNLSERISKSHALSSTRQSEVAQASPHGQEAVHRSLESSIDGTTNEHVRVMQNVERKTALRETSNENWQQTNDLSVMAVLQNSLQQEQDRAEALARELATARRELEASAALSSNAVAEAARVKQSAESATAELRQLLQQERARAEALARELTTARREIDASVVQPNMQGRGEEQIPSAPKLLSIPATPAPRPALTSAAPSSHPPSIIPTPVPRPALTSAATPSQPAIRRRSRSALRQSVKSKPRSSRSDLTFGTRKRFFQQPTKRLP